MQTFRLFGFVVLLILAGCKPQKTITTSGTQGSKYSEDLSIWRPKVELPKDSAGYTTSSNKTPKKNSTTPARFAVNSQLDAVLDSIARINHSRRSVEGYTIQIYSGNKEGALQAKKQLARVLPEINADLNFVTPTFRVKAGRYYTRMDAQRDFLSIKKHFPNAIVIPDRIGIN